MEDIKIEGITFRYYESTGFYYHLVGQNLAGIGMTQDEVMELASSQKRSLEMDTEKQLHMIEKRICPSCKRLIQIEYGFFVTHKEDPPSTVICSNSGSYCSFD